MKTYPLSEIKEYQHLAADTHIRDIIYADQGLNGLSLFLQKQVLNTYNPHSHLQPQASLLQQLAKHYTNVQISQAIAQAWLDNSNTFSLPKLSFVERYGKIKIVAIGTFLTVVPIMTWGTLKLRKDFPETVGVFIALEPMLALPGAVVSIAVFWLVMKWWK